MLDELKNNIIEMADIFEPDDILETIAGALEIAAIVQREGDPENGEIFQAGADSLQDTVNEFYE